MGPAKTDEFSDTIAAVGQTVHSLSVVPGTVAVSYVAQASIAAPIQLVLIDPSGATLATAGNGSGYATIEAPVSANGVYLLKVVNLSAGPVTVWTAATALAAR